MQGAAERLNTDRNWKDLKMSFSTRFQLNEIINWWEAREKLRNKFGRSIILKRGLFLLFQGPARSGKKTAAALLGKRLNLTVYRINLSAVVSKYIGETEKNIGRLLDKVERKSGILFFDEADALFGKRTDIRDAHDRYANQEVSYLLKRLEDFSGIVILTSNKKINLDEEVIRRFHRRIRFDDEASDK